MQFKGFKTHRDLILDSAEYIGTPVIIALVAMTYVYLQFRRKKSEALLALVILNFVFGTLCIIYFVGLWSIDGLHHPMLFAITIFNIISVIAAKFMSHSHHA